MTKSDITHLIMQDKWMMNILRTVKNLKLPDWWIGAGFVRSKVWDTLHGYTHPTAIPDIDIIYFDPTDFTNIEAEKHSTQAEEKYQKELTSKYPDIAWSVTNQARMHRFHKHSPYKNSEDALAHWIETATCIGCRLNQNNLVTLITPWGIEDLVNLIVRPTPTYQHDQQVFTDRIQKKQWLKKWPKLKIVNK